MQTRPFIRFNCNGAFIAPFATMYAICNSVGLNSCFFAPFHHQLCAPKRRNKYVRFAVASLFLLSAPFNIAFFVMPFIVNALYGMLFCGSASNRIQQIQDRFQSTFNAIATIRRICVRTWILTSFFQSVKNVVFIGSITISRFAVYGSGLLQAFIFQTSTRLSVTIHQLTGVYNDKLATFALAQPSRFSIRFCFGIANNKQTPKSLSIQIFNSFIEMWKCSRISYRHFVQTILLNNLASRVARTLNSLQPAFIITQVA